VQTSPLYLKIKKPDPIKSLDFTLSKRQILMIWRILIPLKFDGLFLLFAGCILFGHSLRIQALYQTSRWKVL
jgi:hypothetical protein